MSYGKKDEDADQVMIKLDRTSVFQDGGLSRINPPEP
jgi:coatomer protein complex subunit gamma